MEGKGPNTALSDFKDNLFNPTQLDTLRGSSDTVTVSLFRTKDAPIELVIKDIYSFMTLQDLKTAICVALSDQKERVGEVKYALPEFIYLAQMFPGKKTKPVDFAWMLPDTSLANPFDLVTGVVPVDGQFVDSTGEQKVLGIAQNDRMTIEAVFLKNKEGAKVPTLQAYLYEDLYAILPGEKPPSERDWNGRLWCFFPRLGVNTDAPPPALSEHRNRIVSLFIKNQRQLNLIEKRLSQKKELPLIPLSLAGIKYLRLVWPKPKTTPGIEAIFYEAAVTPRRPFMRLLPVAGSPISKVYFNTTGVPDIKPEDLLVQWAEQPNPTPERDIVFSKILVRAAQTNITPIYATALLLDDGTAQFIVEPPKGVKRLVPSTELNDIDLIIEQGLQGLSHLSSLPDLLRGDFIFGFKFNDPNTPPIRQTVLREKLKAFSYAFHEIAPLPGERPLLMLRYKLVTNFVTEDRIFAYITQLINQKVHPSNYEGLVANEFQLDTAEARKRVAQKLQNQAALALVSPETHEYAKNNNPGIDIAVFSQRNFYSFHIYRVDSAKNLKRILTFLSMLFSIPAEFLIVSAESEKEREVEEVAEAVAGYGIAPGSEASLEKGQGQGQRPEQEQEQEKAPVEVALGLENTALDDEFADFDVGAFGGVEDDDAAAAKESNTLEAVKQREDALLKEGAALPDTSPLAAYAVSPIVAPLVKARPSTGANPKEERVGVKGSAAATPTAAVAAAATEEEEEGEEEEGDHSLKSFFLNKLKDADKRLFDYGKTHPSLKKYVSQCQITHMRQPAVMSDERYQAMKRIYTDEDIQWHEYPLVAGEKEWSHLGESKKDNPDKEEFFTALQYGTDKDKQNWYLCSRYFCTRDEIIVLKNEFETDKGRPVLDTDGKRKYDDKGILIRQKKLPNTCPFCGGKKIQNRRAPQPNETVMERTVKPKTLKGRHLYIRFLKKSPHPEKFGLPCCFLEENTIKDTDPSFDKLKELQIPMRSTSSKVAPVSKAAEDQLLEEDEDEAEKREEEGDEAIEQEELEESLLGIPAKDETGVPILDYVVLLAGITRRPNQHIVGSEKFPLEIGISPPTKEKAKKGEEDKQAPAQPQIGLVLPPLDSYFSQNPINLIERAGVVMKLKPGATGFFRVGVENRQRYQNDSFLSAIAPFYMQNSAREMKKFFLREIKRNLKIYLSLNYGNLLLEFYKPTDRPSDMTKVDGKIRAWCKDAIGTDVSDANREQMIRFYYSYRRFEAWLLSQTERKDYRHFAMMCAQSNFLNGPGTAGTTFIVIDVLKGSENAQIKVRCPPFGYHQELMDQNNVAFILHHWSGVWEPLFFIDNRSPSLRGPESHTLLFENAKKGSWPEIVKTRVKEFASQCHSETRAVYTSQSKINTLKLIAVSNAKRGIDAIASIQYVGYIRDSYNHLVAMVVKEKLEGAGLVAIPVADDGSFLPLNGEVFLDWDDFTPAPAAEVINFYKKYIYTTFSIYRNYRIDRVVKSRGTDSIAAVQLHNGLYVPVTNVPVPEGTPSAEIDEMEWKLNHEIIFEGSESVRADSAAVLHEKEFDEIFQHLRLTFSNWLAAADGGAGLRSALEEFIFTDTLPLFEKRKRLEILIGPTVSEWITSDTTEGDEKHSASLLRVDCRIRSEGQCSGACQWKPEESTTKCKIHATPSKEAVSAPRILLMRLIEELLRYAKRRQEMFDQEVVRISSLDTKVLVIPSKNGGEQHIYSDRSRSWEELLRLEWADTRERPIFLEEMSRSAIASVAAPITTETAVSESIQTVLGTTDPKTASLRLIRGDLQTLLSVAEVSIDDVAAIPAEMNEETVKAIVRATQRPVVFINPTANPPVIGRAPIRVTVPGIVILVQTETGLGLLVLNPVEPELPLKTEVPESILKLVERGTVLPTRLKK